MVVSPFLYQPFSWRTFIWKVVSFLISHFFVGGELAFLLGFSVGTFSTTNVIPSINLAIFSIKVLAPLPFVEGNIPSILMIELSPCPDLDSWFCPNKEPELLVVKTNPPPNYLVLLCFAEFCSSCLGKTLDAVSLIVCKAPSLKILVPVSLVLLTIILGGVGSVL